MKKTIAIIALGAALCGCQSAPEVSPEQLSIQAVYSVDSRVTTNSKSPAEVVDKLQSIRLNGCPAEFVDAYRRLHQGLGIARGGDQEDVRAEHAESLFGHLDFRFRLPVQAH